MQLLSKTETLYAEISNVLHSIEHKSTPGRDPSDENELLGHVMELEDIAENEKHHYKDVLEPASLEVSISIQPTIDILELNGLRRSLRLGSQAIHIRLPNQHCHSELKGLAWRIIFHRAQRSEK
ncbi:unnamed protein product [Rhodiola kirilowii]